MKIKDSIILICCLWVINVNPTTIQSPPLIQTNVKNKVALFIGDSHTSNHQYGWQIQLSKSVGFKMINASVSGKSTDWMLEQSVYRINSNIDYCFVYGGANDMYGGISPTDAINNIKGISRICNSHGVKCIVLTGFDAGKCTKTHKPKYVKKYILFQKLLLTQDLDGAIIVDIRVIDKMDCWDKFCHMRPSGHKKISEKIILDLDLQKI
jgi:hypothetical protein